MSKKYKDVEFLLVYIREAHASDEWQVGANERQGVILAAAKSFEGKDEYASLCVRKLGIEFTTLVDNMDNQVETNYTAWPDRLYLVGSDGVIKFKGKPGPQGFRAKELDEAIQKLLGMAVSKLETRAPAGG